MLNKRIYNFDFGNKTKQILSYFLIWFSFIGLIIILTGLRGYFCSVLTEKITNIKFAHLLSLTLKYAIDFFALYGLIIQFIPKKIILDKKGIKVRRNCFIRLTSGPFNDYIKYDNIKVCRMNQPEDKYSRYLPLSFPFCNWDSVVVVEERFRRFYIPVKNSEEFIEEVNKRIDAINRKN